MNLRKGMTVMVLAGKDKGKKGAIERVLPKTREVVIAGVNVAKRHIKPNRQYPSGGIIEVAMPLDQSNVKLTEE